MHGLFDLQTITAGHFIQLYTTAGTICFKLFQCFADVAGGWLLFIAEQRSQLAM